MTCDLLIANETLYQLSYDPAPIGRKINTWGQIASGVSTRESLATLKVGCSGGGASRFYRLNFPGK